MRNTILPLSINLLLVGGFGSSKPINILDIEKDLIVVKIPNSDRIHNFLKSHQSPLYPAYRCKNFVSCFLDEISALRLATIQLGGESVGNITDSGKKVANDPNKYLKDAVSIINDRIGLLIQSGSTECISASIDYLLTAFYFVRDRLIELSNNPARFEETLSIFRTLLDDAAATAKHKTTGYSWLGVIKVIRDFRVVRRFLFYKYEKPKQYWVPVAALGVSFLSLRAMAQVANKGKAFDQALNKFREPTLEYWNKYEKADSSTRAMHEGREEVVKRKGEGSKGKKGLSEDRFVLTLVKATYLITAVHDSPVHVLISRMDQIIEWLNSGAEPDHDTWSVLRAVKDIL